MDIDVRLGYNSICRYQNYITENGTNDLLESIKPVSILFHFMMHVQNKKANKKGRNFYALIRVSAGTNSFWA